AVAALGLAVNLLSAYWLHAPGHPQHHHDHDHDHAHHHDLNLRAAYLHVLTDAATSVLAIVALLSGKLLGLGWMDPAIGLAGAALVAAWAIGLVRDTALALIDASPSRPLLEAIRKTVAATAPAVVVVDLHVWRVGNGGHACIVGLRGGNAAEIREVRIALAGVEGISHLTVEILPG
ncbi:MAG: cation transporter, partial [Betaproteobacteria bacterium]|nr:cation transporter [Betaproteobacteria bacterium]